MLAEVPAATAPGTRQQGFPRSAAPAVAGAVRVEDLLPLPWHRHARWGTPSRTTGVKLQTAATTSPGSIPRRRKAITLRWTSPLLDPVEAPGLRIELVQGAEGTVEAVQVPQPWPAAPGAGGPGRPLRPRAPGGASPGCAPRSTPPTGRARPP